MSRCKEAIADFRLKILMIFSCLIKILKKSFQRKDTVHGRALVSNQSQALIHGRALVSKLSQAQLHGQALVSKLS